MHTINNLLPINTNYIDVNNKNNKKKIKNSNLDLQKNFLEIFLSQIKNQDPINPLTNTELTSQLTQINTANGIEKINSNLIELKKQIHRNQSFQISSLIGHGVLFPSSKLYYDDSSRNSIFGMDLSEDSTSVNAEIRDQNGKLIFTKNMGPLKSGIHDFSWNGLSNDELQVNNGMYNFSINAKKGNQSVDLSPLTYDKVKSVITSSEDDALINLNHFKEIELQHIRKIF